MRRILIHMTPEELRSKLGLPVALEITEVHTELSGRVHVVAYHPDLPPLPPGYHPPVTPIDNVAAYIEEVTR
jgi:hypothetical protein